jgi:glycosyltransferase involved in cell wall biosynthesis
MLVIGPVEPEFEFAAARTPGLIRLDRGLSPETIRWITEEARVAILPSDYEGFGIPLLEAMSVGVPVIASRNASLPEIAGPEGILVDAASARDFADLIESLHIDIAKRREAVEAGYRRAADFSWRATASAIRDAFLEFG